MRNFSIPALLLFTFSAFCQEKIDTTDSLLQSMPSQDIRGIDGLSGLDYPDQTSFVIDSLSDFLNRYKSDDTVKVNALAAFSRQYQWIDFHISFANADSALRLARRLDYPKGIAMAQNLKAFCFWAFGDNDLGIKAALEAASLMENEGNPSILAESYSVLSRGYGDLREYTKAREYVDRAEELCAKTDNWALMSSIYNWKGVLNIIENDVSGAIYYYKKALQLAIRKNVPKIEFPRIISNIGECYLPTNPDLAFQYFDKALLLARETGNKTAEASIMSIVGHAWMDKGNLAKADRYLTASLQLSKDMGLRRVVRSAYDGMVDLRVKQGRAEEAVEYLKRYVRVRDSLYGASKTRQLIELEARHEIEKKVQAIQLLQQETRIQAIWRNVLIAGVVLLIVVAALIYVLQRSRARKANELLDLQRMHNEKLTEVDRLKTQFFANISHEFRTPLSLILAPLEEELKKRSSRHADTELLLLMKRNANRLLELVNQLLDLSKLEAGKMELKVKRGNFNAFIKVLASSFDSWAQQKSISFEKDISVPAESIWFDQDNIEKIVTNLLANAFKFTPAGGAVKLEVSLKRENNRSLLHVSIADNGKGIPKEEQSEIFLPFYQTRQTVENYQPGTGLGLSLVRELVKLYGGEISLTSEPGKGTLISVNIPADEQSFQPSQIYNPDPDGYTTGSLGTTRGAEDLPDDVAEESELSGEGKDSILIAEDNADLLNFIASILEPQYTVYKAIRGDEALSIALRNIPSLILSDVMMPGLDGMQLAGKIKRDERTSHIPFVLLTAKNDPQSKLEGLKTGVDDYLTKPFSTEELLVRIENLIEQRKQLAVRFRERILVPASQTHEASLDEKFLQKVRSVVEMNMGEFTFGVEQLASDINLSRTQLLRKLKALTGLSPTEFIKDLRLKKAADMIRHKTDTITQIGYTVGFNDQSYFTKCFKKQFGVTPSDYSLQVGKVLR